MPFRIKQHVQHQIPPFAHTPMYVWHKYWGRKPWNIVSKFISTYTKKGDVVIDPFMGSGVTIFESLKLGRRAIGVDLNPISYEIVKATITHCPVSKIKKAFELIEKNVKSEINGLYRTKCPSCKAENIVQASRCVRKNNKINLKDIRFNCSECKGDYKSGVNPKKYDLDIFKKCDVKKSEDLVKLSQYRLYYEANGFQEKQNYESLRDMFTDRNYKACLIIIKEINKISDQKVKNQLRVAFSSMIHLCTTMMPVRKSRAMSGCWTQHSYWYANEFLEQNVWSKFESAVTGKQGLLKAKEESNKFFKDIKFAKNLTELFSGKGDVYLECNSALRVMKKIKKSGNSVQYCFTDPPYNGSIQYGELSYLWAVWLGHGDGYVTSLVDSEVIENRSQKKDFDTYHSLLRSTLNNLYSILERGRYLHLTFTNPKTKYRNMTLNSAMFAGFEFEEIHHQEGARSSAKSLLQPFGSVSGDFYLRFNKNPKFSVSDKEKLTLNKFEKIVINSAKKIILNRGEPTQYTSIIEEVDKTLYNEGFFIEVATKDFDVEKVMKNNIGKIFQLVDVEVGQLKGKYWWLEDSEKEKFKIPLNERVEQVVLDLLKSNYEISFTDVWEKVGVAFPNSLTPDTISITKTLDEYASKTKSGSWRLNPIVLEHSTQHSEMIHILARLGKVLGFDVHVGKREQRDSSKYFGKLVSLKSLCTDKKPKLENTEFTSKEALLNVDLIWYRKGKVTHCFEVESTTSITSALERVSSVRDSDVKRFLILPDEREKLFKKKMQLHHFSNSFQNGDWSVVYFNELRGQSNRLLSKKISLEKLVGIVNAEKQLSLMSEGDLEEKLKKIIKKAKKQSKKTKKGTRKREAS